MEIPAGPISARILQDFYILLNSQTAEGGYKVYVEVSAQHLYIATNFVIAPPKKM
jgi:hypothetical protein